MGLLEAVLAFNLTLLGLWVALRVLMAAYNRQVDTLVMGLAPPGEDKDADALRDELREVRILGPLWGRRKLAELRVKVHAWQHGVMIPAEPIE